MRNPSPATMLIALRLVFWCTLLFTFVSAELPPSHAPSLFPWDKAEHFSAFFVLTCLAGAAFPRRPLVIMALALSLFGCVIELVQALPFIHRDCDVWDWVADTIGIAAATLPSILVRWRTFYETYSKLREHGA